MATRQNMVEYWFPHLTTAADNTDTNFSQITLYLPESSKNFLFVKFHVVYHDANTTLTGTNNRRQVSLQLGSAGYSAVNNTNTYTLSGENYIGAHDGDFTSYFNTNWSGTSMTCDARFLYDMSTASPVGARNLSGRLIIVYEYDDTSATKVKTVRIPLDAPVGTPGTTKPGTAVATIPALDTRLGEASKNIRQTTVVIQGNNTLNATTDNSISFEIDSLGAFTSQLYEQGGTQAMFFRINQVVSFTTNASHSFYLWASAGFQHVQAWLNVTYEYDEASSTVIEQSLLLPMELASPMGGTTSADFQRGYREFWIQEPGTITTRELAFFAFWDQAAAIASPTMRIGTGGWTTYQDSIAAIMAGSNAAMCRNDSAFTLARGRNILNFDIYRTDTLDYGFNLSGFWIVNYSSGKATAGSGSHNKTIFQNICDYGTNAAALFRTISAIAPTVPQNNYFISAIGTQLEYISNTTGNPAGITLQCRDDNNEEWLSCYTDIAHSDPETGIRQCFSQMRSLFKRFAGDVDASRLNLSTTRQWRIYTANGCNAFFSADLIYTVHWLTSTVAANVTGSSGGTVTLNLCRSGTGERLLQTTRVGNGAYSFKWFDNTENVFVEAKEGSSLLGRSDDGLATLD